MLRSIVLRSPPLPSALLLDSQRSSCRRNSAFVCSCERSSWSIPKLKPFSRSRIERMMPEPTLLEKCKNDLTDYCTTLEGDESCSCWRAYFELQDLEKELPKEEVEKLVRQADGRKFLIDCLHGITAMNKRYGKQRPKPTSLVAEAQKEKPFPVPDGLPKSQEELEEEEKAKMPDSPYTRLLRSKGRAPAWYTHRPDHETD